MRKWCIIGGVSAVAVVFLGLPYLFGIHTQSLEDKLVAKVNDYLQEKQGTVNTDNFQVLASFTVTEKTYHGPLYFAQDANGKSHVGFGRGYLSATIDPDDSTAQWLKNNGVTSTGPYWMSRNARVSLLGHIAVNGIMPGIVYANAANNSRIEIGSVTSHGEISSGLDELEGKVSINNLKITSPEGNVDVPMIRFKANNTEKEKDLWVGSNEMTIPSANVTQNNNSVFSLTDLSVKTATSFKDSLLGASLNLGAKQIVVGGTDYGPSNYTMSVNGLDEKAWTEIENLLQQYNQLTQTNTLKVVLKRQSYHKGWFSSTATFVVELGEEGTPSTQTLNELAKKTQAILLTNQIVAQIPDLVNNGASLEIEMKEQKTARGNIALKGKLAFPKAEEGASSQLTDLVKNANGSIFIKVPVGLAQELMAQVSGSTADNALPSDVMDEAKARLEALEKAGYLKADGESYVFDLSYDKGSLSLNGKSITAADQGVMIPMGSAPAPATGMSAPALPAAGTPVTQ